MLFATEDKKSYVLQTEWFGIIKFSILFFYMLMNENNFLAKKQGSWVLGGGWNNDLWGGELPVASWIDDITPYNPVRSQALSFITLSA